MVDSPTCLTTSPGISAHSERLLRYKPVDQLLEAQATVPGWKLGWLKVGSGMRQAFRSCDTAPANAISESLDGFRYGIHSRLFAMPAGGLSSVLTLEALATVKACCIQIEPMATM